MLGDVLHQLLTLRGWPVYAVVAALVFGETALVLGLVLPGETAVVLGGVLAGRGHATPVLLILTVIAAAVAGDSVGFLFGARLREPVLRRWPDGRVSRTVDRAHDLLAARGGRAILAGRFVPFVRTALPDAAALAGIRYRRYIAFAATAATVWATVCVLLGYLLGTVAVRLGGALGLVVLVVAVTAGVVLARRHR